MAQEKEQEATQVAQAIPAPAQKKLIEIPKRDKEIKSAVKPKTQPIGRDALFREFFKRDPNKDELQRFDRLETLMGVPRDDSLWYYVLLQEFYDDKQKKRLESIETVSKDAAARALERIASAVVKKADDLAAEKSRAFTWRSLGYYMTPVLLFGALTYGAGVVMGSGHYPFWLRSGSALQSVLSCILNIPSGWILFLGLSPYFLEQYSKSVDRLNEIKDSARFPDNDKKNGKDKARLWGKAVSSLLLLGFVMIIVFYSTGFDFILGKLLAGN